MQSKYLTKILIVLLVAMASLATWQSAGSAKAEGTEILKITVGKATKLTSQTYQNTSAMTGSRTGTVAVFYPKPPRGVKKIRVSKT